MNGCQKCKKGYKSIRNFWLLVVMLFISVNSCAETAVGFQFFTFSDTIKGVIFYPTSENSEHATKLGPYHIQAKQNAEILVGVSPLIIISHGNGGSSISHYDTALYLAQRGYFVASIEHDKDNYRDSSALGTKEYWANRPKQISLLLDYLLSNKVWSQYINSEEIGFMGFSAGTYTGLILADGTPNFDLLSDYCRQTTLTLPYCQFALPPGLNTYMAQQHLADKRIRVYVLLAPFAIPFTPESLSSIKPIIYMAAAEQDPLVETKENADKLARYLPQVVGYDKIAHAGHFIFLAPCSDELKQQLPSLCKDPAGTDRVMIHQALNDKIEQIFQSLRIIVCD